MLDRTETLTKVEDGQEAVLKRLIELGQSILPEGISPSAIGVAAPGPLDAKTGTILKAETLPRWSHVPLGKIISEAFGNVKTFVQNDGNLGAIAEYHLGAGQGANPMIYLTVSTGIGGGAIIGGQLFTGSKTLAIEPGHMRFTLPDGSHRRLEELASGTALGEWAKHYLKTSDMASVLRDLATVDGKAVGKAAIEGDTLAIRVVTDAGRWFGLGLVNLLHLFNPEAIVIGGSVTNLEDLYLNPVRETIQQNILYADFYHDNLIRLAKITEDMCLVGAMLFCKYHIED
jgi:glucokinase